MISDLLTVVIIALMGVLVVYPASRALWQTWEARQRRQAHHDQLIRRR